MKDKSTAVVQGIVTEVPQVWVLGSTEPGGWWLEWCPVPHSGDLRALGSAELGLPTLLRCWQLSCRGQRCAFSLVSSSLGSSHSLFNSSGSASSWTMGTDDSPNVTDDAADEIMDRIVKSATQVPSQRVVPRERKRSRANRKSRKYL